MTAKTDIKFEQLEYCPVCASKESQLLYKLPDRLYSNDATLLFDYSHCNSCGATYLSKRVDESQLGSFYPDSYAPYSNSSPKKKRPALDYFIRRLEKITTRPFNNLANKKGNQKIQKMYQENKGKLLDYGCGGPTFLNNAKKLGWDTYGADFTEYPVNEVIKSGHKAFLIDQGINKSVNDNSFDLIRMNHVYEHVYSPDIINKFLIKKLKRKGILHIVMPNPKGISTILFKKNSLAIEPPRHTILYPPKLIKETLERAGFSNIEIIGEHTSKNFCRSLSICKHSLFRKSIPMNSILSQHEKVYSGIIYSPVILISWLLNMPDIYHVLAEKK